MSSPSSRNPTTPPPLTSSSGIARGNSGLLRLPLTMDLPAPSHPAWVRLIQDPTFHEFKYAAAGMLLFNLNLQWKRDPVKLSSFVNQAHEFFRKYQHLLAEDMGKIFK